MGIAYGVTTNFQATKGIVQDGLVLNLDAGVKESYNGGTTWRDLAGGNNGTLTNSPVFDKQKGGTISFDGTDDFIQASVDTSVVTGDGSISIWLIWTTETFGIFNIKSGFGGGNYTVGQYWGIQNRFTTGTYLQFHSGQGYGSNINLSLTTGNWINVCVTYNGSGGSGKVYANGSFISNASWTAFDTPDGDIRFGSGGYQTSDYSGDHAIINLYNRQLTAAEVSRNFNVMRHRFGI
jgi:hypothetical protein